MNNENKTNINWYPGHMAKTIRELKEKIDLIDIVFEVIDARIPMSSKNKDIENLIIKKPHILIMTKADLCDENKTNKWKKYYEEKGYVVILINLLNNPNMRLLFDKINPLINEINEKRRSKGLKPRKVRVAVLGIPNVGKSTLINRLVGKRSTKVGDRPGITKNLEWIRINDKLELLDTPGVLWPKLDEKSAYNLAAMTAIKEEVLNLDDVAIYVVKKMLSCYEENIVKRYSLTEKKDIVKILDEIGQKIGAIKNNETDYERVYRRIIKDLQDGYLGKITFDEK